jgi:hypothetical protein
MLRPSAMRAHAIARGAPARVRGSIAARMRLSRGLLLLLLAAYCAWGLLYIQRTSFLVEGERVYTLWDDAMISMRYARNLADGRGFTWNGDSERVQGFTNPAPTLAMALLHLTPLSPTRVSGVFQLAMLALLLASLARVHRLAGLCFGADTPVPIAASLLSAASGPLAVWGLQGSDVAPQAFVLLAALCAIVARDVQGRPWPRRAFYALAAGIWIRPDTTVYLLAVLAAAAALAPNRRQCLLHGVAGLAGAWAALVALGLGYYGDALPNTWYLKATGSPRALVWASGLDQLSFLLGATWPVAAVCALGLVLLRRERWLWLFASVIGATAAYHVQVGGDWLPEQVSRYLVPLVPLVALLYAGVAWRAAVLLSARVPPVVGALAFAVALLAGLWTSSPPAPRAEWLSASAPTLLRNYNERLYRYGTYLRDHSDADTVIAVHWAGLTAYFADRPAVDMLGRSDRHIAHLAVQGFAPGHSKWDWDYLVYERRPDVILGADRGLESHPGFLAHYAPARAEQVLTFFLRTDSVAKIRDPALVYPDAPAR